MHETIEYASHVLPADAPKRCTVRSLCEQQSPGATALARKTEQWYAELAAGRGTLRTRLLSAENTEFWSAWWELAYARLFQNIGFKPEIEPKVDGKRPDLAITRDGLRVLVEVLNVGPSEDTRLDERRREDVAALLEGEVHVPTGYLSLMLDAMEVEPDPCDVVACAAQLAEFLADPANLAKRIDIDTPTVRGYGRWNEHGNAPGVLAIVPSGRWIGSHERWQARLDEKMTKYNNTEPETPLVIATGMNDWTLSPDSVIDALFGQEQLILDPADLDKASGTLQRTGFGSAVPLSGDDRPNRVAAVFVASLHGAYLDDDCCGLTVFSLHIPYPSVARLPNDWSAPLTEWQVAGDELVRVRPENESQYLR